MQQNHPTILDPIEIDLAKGVHLVEASAGTGKTYTIANLFIRLIIEKKLKSENILVVTFTEAATEELRDRIRKRLNLTLRVFQKQQPIPENDTTLQALVHKYQDHPPIINLLNNALRGFDEAAIYTIHGFCRRTLQDNAFESGVLFDTQLIHNQYAILREIAEDFWRKHFYQRSALFISYATEKSFKQPEDLLKLLKNGNYLSQPFLTILPETVTVTDSTPAEQIFSDIFHQAKDLWQQEKAEIKMLLQQAIEKKQLKGNIYKSSMLMTWSWQWTAYFNQTQPSLDLPDILQKDGKFTTEHLTANTSKNKPTPQHPFFDLAGQLLAAQQVLIEHYDNIILQLTIQLFQFAKQALVDKKTKKNVQSFDDLLLNLHTALQSNNGENLARFLRQKYRAALIDEFQDTDPLQYQIFNTIYAPHENTLFLIGDPKQAIYSFRGADIFAYMKAKNTANYYYTLATNWRSDERLIHAINTLFSNIPQNQAFIFAEIPFYPVKPPSSLERKDFVRLTLEGSSPPPLHFWLFDRQLYELDENKPISQEKAVLPITKAVAFEIAHLLNLAQDGRAKIGEKPLTAGDIAILVRKNEQAFAVQKQLLQYGIPSVLYSRDSIFNTHEVLEIQRILQAVADPHNETLIKSALTTDMLGMNGTELYFLIDNPQQWQERLKNFHDYYSLWQQSSFMQMFRALLVEEKVAQRLLNYPDGERRLTNILHIGEILQQTALQEKLSLNALNHWLAQQVEAADPDNEEQQLRLESDEKRVKIVTIHKSKGLEYPIVFCPFVGEGKSEKMRLPFIFHDAEKNLLLDVGSEEHAHHWEAAKIEEKAENLRLLYVALTRAQHRCYVVWGALSQAEHSSLAHLLGISIDKQTGDAELRENLQALINKSQQTIALSPLPHQAHRYQAMPEELPILQPRHFTGKIETQWKVASFTALSANVRRAANPEQPDYDEHIPRVTTTPSEHETEQLSIFDFPRGARAGIFLHTLLETIDFMGSAEEWQVILKKQLIQHGFGQYTEENWLISLQNFLFAVVNTPLSTPASSPFNLAAIASRKRLNELEFYYPLAPVTGQQLQTIFNRFGHQDKPLTEKIGRLEFSPVRGLMKGYIDMIFEHQGRYYLVDYKTHYLGNQPDFYHYQRLESTMRREAYFLQYHIYSIALHRYLATRLENYDYQQHFGGVFYLFVRGMKPEWGPEFGVYYDLPNARLIQELSQTLLVS